MSREAALTNFENRITSHLNKILSKGEYKISIIRSTVISATIDLTFLHI